MIAQPDEKMLNLWNDLVRTIIRKSKGLKPNDEVTLPQLKHKRNRWDPHTLGPSGPIYSLPLPTSTYIKYALDNQGRLSAGKVQGGRKHPHWRPGMNAMKSLTLRLFKTAFAEFERVEALDAAAEGREFKGLSPNTVQDIINQSSREAMLYLRHVALARRAAKHVRQDISRRINYGLATANRFRLNCAHAS